MARTLPVRALVFSAGLGSRLRPLTQRIPKPLLFLGGARLLQHTLERLARSGVPAIAVNTHHLSDQIEDFLRQEAFDPEVRVSFEERLLGTLGALGPLRDFLSEAPNVLLVNGDSLCHWPIRSLVRRHVKSQVDATLLTLKRPDPQEFGGGVEVDKQGRIVRFRALPEQLPEGHRRRVFGGAHLLKTAVLDAMDLWSTQGDIITGLYEPLLRARGQVATVESSVRWHDVGTPNRWLDAAADWSKTRGRRFPRARKWVHPDADLGRAVRIRSSCIEQGASIGERSRVDQSVVLPGAFVGARSSLRRVLVAPGVRLPPGTRLERRMVTPLAWGRLEGAADSVFEDLVFTPIDR